jgi:thioredoxin 1
MANSKNVLIAEDSTFKSSVLEGSGLSMVDFWAEWCGPCRILGPLIEQIADENVGKVKVYKMDVDAHPETAPQYGIRGIPTVIFFKGGQVVHQMVGVQPKEAYVEAIKKFG